MKNTQNVYKDLALNICQALESVPAYNIISQIKPSLDFTFLPISYLKPGRERACLMGRGDKRRKWRIRENMKNTVFLYLLELTFPVEETSFSCYTILTILVA